MSKVNATVQKVQLKKKTLDETALEKDYNRLQWEGYDAPYMTPEGMKVEHITFPGEPCPNSRSAQGMNLIRRCSKIHYYQAMMKGEAAFAVDVGYPCPPRACYLHWKECPFR